MVEQAEAKKMLYEYTTPLGGKRTNVVGGYIPALEELQRYERLNPVDFEILSYRMHSICNEARQAVLRVSGSPVVAEGGECLFAIYDPWGYTTSMACGLLLHLAGTQNNIKEVIEVQGTSPGIRDGDIFMVNEPWVAGYHACDQWTGTPVFVDGELIAWLGSLTHTAETGAIEPGGIPAGARSLLDEGYRVQGIKVQEQGRLNQAAINCLLRSSRDPAYYVLDLRARIAGLNVAKERFMKLIERYGVDKIKSAIQQNIDHGEAMARAKLRSLADGTWRSVVYVDWDIGPTPKLIKIATTMRKTGDELALDFDASPPNSGYFNCYPPGTFGLVFVAVASQLFWETPGNWGFIKPIKVHIPEGSCLSAPYLTPVGLCAALPVTDAVTMTIAKMFYTNEKLWGDINAPWARGASAGVFWGGLTQYGYPSGSLFSESWASGTGAGIDQGRGDGCDTGGLMMTIESSISDVEMMELMAPFLYLWRREGMDNAGPGKWRGGATAGYAVTPHNSPYVLVGFSGYGCYADSMQALDGAYPPGMESDGIIARGLNLKDAFQQGYIPQNIDELREMTDKSMGLIETVTHPLPTIPLSTDTDVAVSVRGGAKGVGDPLDREPERVLEDVINKVVSIEAAREVYGVVIDPDKLEIDYKATDDKKGQIMQNRRENGKVWEDN
ncbi:hydantoinase B/oxoprolinase family protein [Chloroflexota bacterium]